MAHRQHASRIAARVGLGWGILAAAGAIAVGQQPKAPPAADMAQYFGFKRVEIFKLEPRVSNLLTGDFNGDGRTDLVVFDNGHACIDLLLQRAKPSDAPIETVSYSVNEVKGDWRFEHKKIPVDKQLASLTVGDFNGDGRTDIACFGVPDRLMIWYQPASGDWREHTTIRVPDVAPALWNMAAGDLNGDHKDDLVVLGRRQTYLFLQHAKQGLTTPTILMNTSEKLALAQVADLNGDGRGDLCYVAGDGQDRTLCARLQDSAGRIGPEMQFEVDRPRSVSYAELDGHPGREILTIDGQTGRLRILQMTQPTATEDDSVGRLVQTGFGRQDSSDTSRDFALGDVDGDGLVDLVVTDPEDAAVVMFRQRKGEGLDPGQSFPSLSGAVQVRVASFGEGAEREVIVLSTKERTIGASRFSGGRLGFPESLPVADDEPLLLETADLNGDGRPEIIYLSRIRSSRATQYVLHAIERVEQKGWRPFAFGAANAASMPIEIAGTPTHLVRFETNRDGRPNFLLFQGSDRAPLVLSARPDGKIVVLPVEGGPRLGNVGPGAAFFTTDKAPTILVAQDNFARKLERGADQTWRVVDQYNATEPSARVVGSAMIDLDGRPGREIVLIDSGIRKLRVLRQEGELFRPMKEIELGAFPYEAVRVIDLNGDGRDDLLLIGRGRFAVLYAGRSVPTLTELATFETKLTKAFFADVVAGDLNSDGRTDLALIDTLSHNVEITYLDAQNRPRHALNFKVFEEKSFNEGLQGGTEPRESAIADVTGDGKPDLILLAHDRILVYPQDDGK